MDEKLPRLNKYFGHFCRFILYTQNPVHFVLDKLFKFLFVFFCFRSSSESMGLSPYRTRRIDAGPQASRLANKLVQQSTEI